MELLLLVVWQVAADCASAIQLFAKYNSAKLVWQSDFAKRKSQIALVFYALVQTVATANDKGKGGVTLLLAFDVLGNLYTVQRFAVNIQSNQATFRLVQDGFCLCFHYFLYLRWVGLAIEKALVHFYNFHRGKARDTLCVLGNSLTEVVFFDFAHYYKFEFHFLLRK